MAGNVSKTKALTAMKIRLCLLLLLAGLSGSAHQPFGLSIKNALFKPFHHLIIGVSGVVIDDDGRPVQGVFSIRNSWNSSYIPSRITVEGGFLKKWGAEFSMAYSRLQAGKIIDGYDGRRTANTNLYTFDLSAKYYPLSVGSMLLGPYTIVGLGYTHKSELIPTNGASVNAGLGLSVWLYKGFGANVQSIGKFTLMNRSTNYLMHTLGVVYRLAK